MNKTAVSSHVFTATLLTSAALGEIAKLRKATTGFVMSVRLFPSVRPHWTWPTIDGFLLNLIFKYFFRNLSRKYKVHWNLTRKTSTFYEDLSTVTPVYCSVLLKWEIFQTKVVQKIKTHILYSNFFFPENRAVYEIMWKIFVLHVG